MILAEFIMGLAPCFFTGYFNLRQDYKNISYLYLIPVYLVGSLYLRAISLGRKTQVIFNF